MNRPDSPFAQPQNPGAADAALTEALRASARQDFAALQRIYQIIAPRLLAELLQMLDDRKLAETALVDCFQQIWEQAGDFNPQRSQPRAWLLSIARRRAIDIQRRTAQDAPDEVDSALGFAHVALHYEGVPAQQRLMQLAWRTGRSVQEIARALNLPLRQARREIRAALDQLAGKPS